MLLFWSFGLPRTVFLWNLLLIKSTWTWLPYLVAAFHPLFFSLYFDVVFPFNNLRYCRCWS
jgi:hypothetical protein